MLFSCLCNGTPESVQVLPSFLTTIILLLIGGVFNIVTVEVVPSTLNSAGNVTSASGLSKSTVLSNELIAFLRKRFPATKISKSFTDFGTKSTVIALVDPSAVNPWVYISSIYVIV